MKIYFLHKLRHIVGLTFSLSLTFSSPQVSAENRTSWRSATATELAAQLPPRAPVQKERIEIEMRTASGIINSQGKLIAGVVLITAGYSADGKYSHYLIVQSPISLGDVPLSIGTYVLGWQRKDDDTLTVSFYDATTGSELGSTIARRLPNGSRVESFRIFPPSERPIVQIGRFAMNYTLTH